MFRFENGVSCICFATISQTKITQTSHLASRTYDNMLCMVIWFSLCTGVAGTGISLAGVFIYSQVKRMSGKKKLA